MSRRRSTTVLHREVRLACDLDRRHDLGSVYLVLPPHPRAGTYGTEDGVTFRDAPGPLGGELLATCSTCGVTQRIRWERVHRVLHDLDATGRHTAVLTMDRVPKERYAPEQ